MALSKKKRAEVQAHIREVAKNPENIHLCSQEVTKQFTSEIDEFLLRVFGIKHAWISDLSSTSDFGQRAWRGKAARIYGLRGLKPDELLIDLAQKIRASRLN